MSDDAALKQQLFIHVKQHADLDPDKVADSVQRDSVAHHRAFAIEVLAASKGPDAVTWADQLHTQVTAHAHGVALEGQVEGAAGETQLRAPVQLKRTIAAEWLMTAKELAGIAPLLESPSNAEMTWTRKNDMQMSAGDMRRCAQQAGERGEGR